MTEISRIMVPGLVAPFSHYCHVVRANGHVWVSGAVGIDENGSVPRDTATQFEVAVRNMDACLVAAGADAESVVRIRIYLTDICDRARINPVRERYFGIHRPASTLVQVSALVMPELSVEIEAEAILQEHV